MRALEMVLSAKVDASVERMVQKAGEAAKAVQGIGQAQTAGGGGRSRGAGSGAGGGRSSGQGKTDAEQAEAQQLNDLERAARATMRSEGVIQGARRAQEARSERERRAREARAERERRQAERDADNAQKAAARDAEKTTRETQRNREREIRLATVAGPYQRLQRAQRAKDRARATGDEDLRRDAEIAEGRALSSVMRFQRQQGRLGRGPFMDRLATVLSTSRVNLGPVSPLAGQAASLLGIPAIGPQMAALVGAAAVVVAFVGGLKMATENLNELGAAARLSGGTAGDVAGIGRFGFRGEAGASAAETFRQRIATDPMAMMFAGRMGIRALPEPFGEVNNASFLLRAAQGLKEIQDGEERLRAARELGLESVLKYLEVSPQLAKTLEDQAALEERIAASGAPKAANEFSVALAAASDAFRNATTRVFAPAETVGARIARAFANVFNGVQPGDAGQQSQDNHTQAMDRLSDSLDSHGKALRAFLQPGTYGGGPMTNNASPAGWEGDFLSRNAEKNALSRGMPGF